MNPPKDSRSFVGLLTYKDGTVAVLGRPHKEVEKAADMLKMHSTVLLTREAGEALYELLGDWLGKDAEKLELEKITGGSSEKAS